MYPPACVPAISHVVANLIEYVVLASLDDQNRAFATGFAPQPIEPASLRD